MVSLAPRGSRFSQASPHVQPADVEHLHAPSQEQVDAQFAAQVQVVAPVVAIVSIVMVRSSCVSGVVLH